MSKEEEVKKILDDSDNWTKVRNTYGDITIDEYFLKRPQVEQQIVKLFSPPPVVGDLREQLIVLLNNYGTDKVVEIADSILDIIKEAGYVKLAKGDKLICKTAWDLLSPMITKGIEVAEKESGWRENGMTDQEPTQQEIQK